MLMKRITKNSQAKQYRVGRESSKIQRKEYHRSENRREHKLYDPVKTGIWNILFHK